MIKKIFFIILFLFCLSCFYNIGSRILLGTDKLDIHGIKTEAEKAVESFDRFADNYKPLAERAVTEKSEKYLKEPSDKTETSEKTEILDKLRVFENQAASGGFTTEEEASLEALRLAENLPQTVTLEISGLSADKIADLLLKSGNFYYLNYTVSRKGREQTVAITPKYKMAYEITYVKRTGDTSVLSLKGRVVYDTVKGLINEIIAPHMTEYEKELAVHDYIVLAAEYDDEAAKTSIREAENKESIDKITGLHDSYTPYGIIAEGKGVCQAYSELMLIFMTMLDIEAEEVTGTGDGEAHSWNRIKIGGEYYNVDVTWNDAKIDGTNALSRAYFNITDDMLSRSHQWDKNEEKSCVSQTYNYFDYNNLIVNSQADFEDIITRAVNDGLLSVEVRLDSLEPDAVSYDFIGNITDKTSVMSSYIDSQRVLWVDLS